MKKLRVLFVILACFILGLSLVACKQEPAPRHYGKMVVIYKDAEPKGLKALKATRELNSGEHEITLLIIDGVVTPDSVKDALKKEGINPEQVVSIEGFEGVTEIKKDAFKADKNTGEGFINLEEVVISKCVNKIGENAFEGISKLDVTFESEKAPNIESALSSGEQEIVVHVPEGAEEEYKDFFEPEEGESIIDPKYQYKEVTATFVLVNKGANHDGVEAPAAQSMQGNYYQRIPSTPTDFDGDKIPRGYKTYEDGAAIKWYISDCATLSDFDVTVATPADFTTVGIEEDTTFYGVFNPIEFTVHYSANVILGEKKESYQIGEGHKMTYDEIEEKLIFPVNGKDYTYDDAGYHIAGWSETKVTKGQSAETYKLFETSSDLATPSDAKYYIKSTVENPLKDGDDVYLYFVEGKNSYTVKFDPNFGDKEVVNCATFSDLDAKFDVNFQLPALTDEFQAKGYNFSGWSTSKTGNKEYNNNAWILKDLCTGIAGDDEITLYAVWTPITYNVAFRKNNGSKFTDLVEAELYKKNVSYDSTIKLPETTKALQLDLKDVGYHFDGWETRKYVENGSYEDSNGKYNVLNKYTTEEVKNLTATDGDLVVLYLSESPLVYSVKFDANAIWYPDKPEGTVNNQTLTFGVENTLTSEVFTRPHYEFMGWAYSDSAKKADYKPGDPVNTDKYDITKQVSSIGADVTLYAVWAPKTYSVTLNYNYDSKNTAKSTFTDLQSFTYKDTVMLPANTFRVTESDLKSESDKVQVFVGWACDPNATASDLVDKATLSYGNSNYLLIVGGAEDKATHTDLYAVWDDAYTIKLYVGSTPDATPSDLVYYAEAPYDKDVTLPDYTDYNDNVDFGYEIVRWVATSSDFDDSEKAVTTVTVTDTDITCCEYYADVDPITYSVVLRTKNDTKTITTLTGNVFGTDVTLPFYNGSSSVGSDTGYHTTGWRNSDNSNIYSATPSDIVAQEGAYSEYNGNKYVSLYEVEAPNTYTIKFDKGEGEVEGTMTDLPATYDDAQNLPANAYTRTGYLFDGWKVGSTTYRDEASVKNLTNVDGGSVTLTAQWEPIKYTVIFWYENDKGENRKFSTIGGQYNYDQEIVLISDYIVETAYEYRKLTGYHFAGWETEDGTSYNTATATNLTATNNDRVDLYLVQKPNTYTVTIYKNDGTLNDVSHTPVSYNFVATYGDFVVLGDGTKFDANNAKYATDTDMNYELLGFSTEATSSDLSLKLNGSGNLEAKGGIFDTAENGATIELYYKWGAKVTVEADLEGFTWKSSPSGKYYVLGTKLTYTYDSGADKSVFNWSGDKAYYKFTFKPGESSREDNYEYQATSVGKRNEQSITINGIDADHRITGPVTINTPQ